MGGASARTQGASPPLIPAHAGIHRGGLPPVSPLGWRGIGGREGRVGGAMRSGMMNGGGWIPVFTGMRGGGGNDGIGGGGGGGGMRGEECGDALGAGMTGMGVGVRGQHVGGGLNEEGGLPLRAAPLSFLSRLFVPVLGGSALPLCGLAYPPITPSRVANSR